MANANYATVSVAISDPVLKRVLLQHLLDQEQTDLPDNLASFLENLRQRPMQDFLALTSARTLQVRIYLGEVVPSLQHLEAQNDEEALLMYFVDHGASRSLLRRLFSVTGARAAELTRAAGLASQGRTRRIAPNVSDQIHEAWYAINKSEPDLPLRARFHVLHRQFQALKIREIEGVLNEFGDPWG